MSTEHQWSRQTLRQGKFSQTIFDFTASSTAPIVACSYNGTGRENLRIIYWDTKWSNSPYNLLTLLQHRLRQYTSSTHTTYDNVYHVAFYSASYSASFFFRRHIFGIGISCTLRRWSLRLSTRPKPLHPFLEQPSLGQSIGVLFWWTSWMWRARALKWEPHILHRAQPGPAGGSYLSITVSNKTPFYTTPHPAARWFIRLTSRHSYLHPLR